MCDNPVLDGLDRATRARLAQLGGMPVDTTNLDRRLKIAIAQELGTPVSAINERRAFQRFRLWRPVSGLAAAIVLAAVTLGILLFGGNASPVIAAPADLARIHQTMDMHSSMGTTVRSIEEANRVIASQWSGAPSLPASSMPSDQIHACCLRDLKGRKVVSVQMYDSANTPITMVVARTQDVKPAQGGTEVQRAGRSYMVNDTNGLRMVMTEGNGKYVCLMGNVPSDELLDIAAGLSL